MNPVFKARVVRHQSSEFLALRCLYIGGWVSKSPMGDRMNVHGLGITNKEFRSLRIKAVIALGDKCKRCGFADRRALQIDHIDGNGAEERRQLGKNSSAVIYARILNKTNHENYQLLCANCNWIKRDMDRTTHSIKRILRKKKERIFAKKTWGYVPSELK